MNMALRLRPFGHVACGLALLALSARTAWPQPPAKTTSKLSIPFAATVPSPLGDEDVDIAGHLIVMVTILCTNTPCKINVTARLASDVKAVGKTFGLPFIAKGTSHRSYLWPVNPTRLTSIIPLHLYPPPTSLRIPLQTVWLLQYQVSYDENGQVTSMEATMVPGPPAGSCSTVVEVCQ
ncbi:MAG TPA: hypothetical protein VMW56_04740 [Candidatus Margulisiibacteriota bacterium]|nr:hypothetical protein [Candidatus Margulisiibacteriota bacterium]